MTAQIGELTMPISKARQAKILREMDDSRRIHQSGYDAVDRAQIDSMVWSIIQYREIANRTQPTPEPDSDERHRVAKILESVDG